MKEVITMRNELLKGLSEEQIKKVEACKSSEEILNLAKAEGIELTDEQLEAVSGGACEDNNVFPNDNGFPKKNPILPDEEKTIVPKNPTIDRKHDIMA